jgi:hypothetical protein
MTLEVFSATSTTQITASPDSYGVDPFRTLGGPYSLKHKLNAMERPLDRSSRTFTSDVNYPPISATSSLGRHRKTIAPWWR